MNEDANQSKTAGKNRVWIAVTILLLIGNIILLYSLISARSDLARYSDVREELSDYDIALTDCRVRLDDAIEREKSTEAQLRAKDGQIKRLKTEVLGVSSLSAEAVTELVQKGLSNPDRDIIADLVLHPEMIPGHSSAVSTTRFFNPKKIFVLNRHLVFAHYSDGKAGGTMILEYDVADGGKISWKPIKAYDNL